MEKAIKTKGDSKNLTSLHSVLAGLKPMISGSVLEDLEECRQSCGGHGYLGTAGLTNILKNQYWLVTVEGENKMIIQQTARYILKTMQRMVQGKEISPDFLYMQEQEKETTFNLKEEIKLSDLKTLLELRAKHTIMRITMKFNQLLQEKPIIEIWN